MKEALIKLNSEIERRALTGGELTPKPTRKPSQGIVVAIFHSLQPKPKPKPKLKLKLKLKPKSNRIESSFAGLDRSQNGFDCLQ